MQDLRVNQVENRSFICHSSPEGDSSMRRLVECVPNFSEGRDLQVIDQITTAIKKTGGIKLLDVDPGADTNRTVVTFIGEPKAVEEAAFQAVKKAAELIDMRLHHGAHARQGAIDVLPFVPVSNISMEETATLAHRVGKRIGDELQIPIYMYEEAATRPERRNLADIRKGEYEGLQEKLKDPNWKPDYGPAKFNARAGATQVGAREFLIAWNVNLNTTDKSLAHDIALEIRETGRAQKDASGKIVKDAQGNTVIKPGRLKAVKAVGWYIDNYKIAQVSVNQINYKTTPLHETYEAVTDEAEKRGLRVLGAELVGLAPEQAILDAAYFYLKKQKRSAGIPKEDLIRIGYKSLGLDTLTPFDPQKKIIEYQAQEINPMKLTTQPVADFVNEVSRESPAPGGGSIAALLGSLGSALAAMVCNLSIGKKGFENVYGELNETAIKAQELKTFFLDAVNRDSDAFNAVMAANRLPKTTAEEQQARTRAIEAANQGAALVPLEVMRKCPEVLSLLTTVAEKGNKNSISDAGVGALCTRAACEGASLNVRINLKSIQDRTFLDATTREHDALIEKTRVMADAVIQHVEQAL